MGTDAGVAGTLKVFYPAVHTGWVIETPSDKVYVIDPGFSAEFYDSRPKHGTGIGTYLKKRGIKTIDAVVITHPHPDHYDAGVELFRDFKVRELIDSGFNPRNNSHGGYNAAFWKAFEKSGAKRHSGIHAGELLAWDPEIIVKVCGPKTPFWTLTDANNDVEKHYNENSVVLWLKHGGVSYLFTGDITPKAQAFLHGQYSAETKETSVLAIPHHGKYYLNDAFARTVGTAHPQLRIGVASKDHTKKGPAADRVPAWRKAGMTIYTGDGHNDITITSTGGAEFMIETTNPAAKKTFH